MRLLSCKITGELAGKSVAAALRRELRLSSSLITRLKTTGGIFKNGLPARTNELTREGDVISAAVGESPAEDGRVPLPFPILFEDEDLLIVNKPAGFGTHVSSYDALPSVEAAVNAYFGRKGLFHPVSRLDRGTTGVMPIAKHGHMHGLMIKDLHTEANERYYLGVCEGVFAEKAGRIDLPIARAEGSAIKREISASGSKAVTDYEVLSEASRPDGRVFSLVRFRLLTGRTHQIRVHCAALSHPLAGDWLYGTEDRALIARPALHSYRLRFIHPITGEKLDISSPMPEDMARILKTEE
ncbi:MAG: RluA family pseudouridine synthase [Clostridia bacterium]|nr:RluA family pseudouridine synthase [Clostridia bacterium]